MRGWLRAGFLPISREGLSPPRPPCPLHVTVTHPGSQGALPARSEPGGGQAAECWLSRDAQLQNESAATGRVWPRSRHKRAAPSPLAKGFGHPTAAPASRPHRCPHPRTHPSRHTRGCLRISFPLLAANRPFIQDPSPSLDVHGVQLCLVGVPGAGQCQGTHRLP